MVNDSGTPLAHQPWQDSTAVQVIVTNRRERGVARNTGAAVAKGRFLHFLDDDDWIAEGAYRHLYELSRETGAKWLYGKTQLLDRNHDPTIILRHGMSGNKFLQAMAGEWIPLQASVIDRKLFWEAGGFNVLLTGPEDIDLQRRMFLRTEIAETPNLVAYVVRGEEGSTTDYLHHAGQSRWAREGILDSKRAFRRMLESADEPLWRGHLTRIYLTSMIWNLQHYGFFAAMNRLTCAILSLLLAGASLFKRKFWNAVFHPYQSLTFSRGIEEARLKRQDSH